MDIETLQRQLKAAIQNHQVLVGRMKSEPKNAILQKQLRELQSQITILSDKQKSYVQQLRKELVNTGSSSLVASHSEDAKLTSVQTIGMSPGVRYSLRPAPGGGMTLMPSGAVVAPISATISLAPSSVGPDGAENIISNGIQSFAVVNPLLHTPVQNVLSLRSPVQIKAGSQPTGAGETLPSSNVNSSCTPGMITRPLVIKSSLQNNVGAQLIVHSSSSHGSTASGVNSSFSQTLVTQGSSPTTMSAGPAANPQQLAILLPKQPLSAVPTKNAVASRPSTPTRSASPLIRVPQFSPGRPNILQGKTTMSVSSPTINSATDVPTSLPFASTSVNGGSLNVPQETVSSTDTSIKDAMKSINSPTSASSKIGVDSPSKKKRKSPHALIRDDPLAHVEASTRFVIPHNSTVATKLDFMTTSTTKVPIGGKTFVGPPSPTTSGSPIQDPSTVVSSASHADGLINVTQSRDINDTCELDGKIKGEAKQEKGVEEKRRCIGEIKTESATHDKDKAKRDKDAATHGKDVANRGKDEANRDKDEATRGKDVANSDKDEANRDKVEATRGKDVANRDKDEATRDKDVAMKLDEIVDDAKTKVVCQGTNASNGKNASSASCPPAIITRNKCQLTKMKVESQSACPKKMDLLNNWKKLKKENVNMGEKVESDLATSSSATSSGTRDLASPSSATSSGTRDRVSAGAVNREKVEFMNALDLVLPSVLKELQNKRSERKRRSTANPHFSYPGNNASGWGDLSNANSKRARLHQAMLAAATAAAEAEASAAASAASAASSAAAASVGPATVSLAATSPRANGRKGGADSPSNGENADNHSSPAPDEASGKIQGKTPPSLKRKSMMAGDRHRREAEEEAEESRPESPASDVSSSSSNNAKNGGQHQAPSPDFHEDACHACSLSTPPLFPCSSCSLVFHPSCLVPPLQTHTPPTPDWRCPQCQPASTPTKGPTASTPTTPTSPGSSAKKLVKKKKKSTSGKKSGAPDGQEKNLLEKSVMEASTPTKIEEPALETSLIEPTLVKSAEMDETDEGVIAGSDSTNYSATLNIMHSYIASKSSKEEEKRKLQRRNAELKAEREQLETKSQQLKVNMQAQNDQHDLLVTAHETIQGQVEKLKNFLKLFQTY